jgi:hypothetical protein
MDINTLAQALSISKNETERKSNELFLEQVIINYNQII